MDIKNEKRKWQIALRRYVIEGLPSSQYAPFFAIDNNLFRQWIECQFIPGIGWDDFGEKWQFDHRAPVSFFNLEKEEELALCWNFLNIRIALEKQTVPNLLEAYHWFRSVYEKTGYTIAEKLMKKLESSLIGENHYSDKLIGLIIQNRDHLNKISRLNADELTRLNGGTEMDVILQEKEILRKFGQ